MLATAIANLLEQHRDQLTENEQRLVQVLSADPGGAIFLSGREVDRKSVV